MESRNIKNYFKNFFLLHTRKPVQEEAQITSSKMSTFLNNRGGMDFQTGIRMLVATNHKIIDPLGNVVYGNPENREQELKDNFIPLAEANEPEPDK